MSRLDFEQAASIRVIDSNRGDALFSAILERDPQFLHWNRISLIGSKDDYRRFLSIKMGPIEWELYENQRWLDLQARELDSRTFGLAITTWSGRASGAAIAHDGIQKFADLEIHKHVQTYAVPGDKLSAIYTFLQRPSGWYAYPRRQLDSLSFRGEWRNVPPLGLKLRLLTIGHRRSDSRISQEVELIDLPGVEIQPIAEMSPDYFISAAGSLWFSIRILLTYRFQQPALTLTEVLRASAKVSTTWHRIELKPRQLVHGIVNDRIFCRLDDLIVEAAPRMEAYRDYFDVLYASVFGYAASFATSVLETRLTQRVEAIE